VKKILALLMLIVLLGASLVACKSDSEATSPQAEVEEEAEAESEAEEEAEAETEVEEETVDETDAPDILGSGETTIVIWHGWLGEYYNAIKQIFDDYATENGVQIELLHVENVNDKAQLAIPAGQGPDIIAWVNDRVGDSALAGIIQPLSEYGVDEEYLRSNFTDVATDAMLYHGEVYGIPESMEANTLIYNKALISEEEIPATTDELLEMAAEYNEPPEKYLFVYHAQNDIYSASPWFQAMGVELVKQDGTTDVGNEASVKAAELIQEFSAIMPAECDYGTMDALFKDGKAAMVMNGPWIIADLDSIGMDYGLAPIPVMSASGVPGAPFVGVKLLMLAENAKNPEAAVELMKFYGSADVQAQLARVNKQVPANKEAQEQVKDDPIIAAFIEQAANGKPMPSSEYISAMWEPFNKMIEAIWVGAAAPEEAVLEGAELFAQIVEEMK